jgi:hypothetical protein
MKYCLLEMSHEQEVVDNAVERGRWNWGMQAVLRLFRELWLEERGSGRGWWCLDLSLLSTAFGNRWAQQEEGSQGWS